MRLYEVTAQIKTYIARVRLKSGAIVTTTERTESLTFARQLLQHKFGDGNVLSVNELFERMDEIDEATQTMTPQQLQVKALADKAKQATEQKKQLQARQAMAKAQEKLRDANKAVTST